MGSRPDDTDEPRAVHKVQAKQGKQAKRSLAAFVHDARKKDCAVCRLPLPLREEIRSFKVRRRIPVSVIVEWLQVEHGITLTEEEWNHHQSAGHEWRDSSRKQGNAAR